MSKVSAGLLMYRRDHDGPRVLLVHPGGPFWRNRDDGAWTIPKGEVEADDDLLATAVREFEEEVGVRPSGPFDPLSHVKQRGGKLVHAWAVEGSVDTTTIRSNMFVTEWPPGSGKRVEFPEIDRAAFFDIATARTKINAAQVTLLDELEALLSER